MKIKILKERKLTPTEKDNREKIAKGIEKDNPDMPMDKKMAIATAQAKKKEEQIDEMSAMSGGAVGGSSGKIIDEEDETLEELYSSKGSMMTASDSDDPEGSLEWGRARGMQNFKVRSESLFHDKWRDFLKS